MKEKHPCESEWYAKALRHLLVQYKESLSLVICKFLHKLHNSPCNHKRRGSFYFQPKAICSTLKSVRVQSSYDLLTVEAVRQEILACLIQSWLMTCLSVLECVCSLRRLQTGWCCLSSTAHNRMTTEQTKAPAMTWEGVKSCTFMLLLKRGKSCVSAWVLNTWMFFLFVQKLCYLYTGKVSFFNLNTAYDRWLSTHFTASYPQIGFTSYRCNVALEDSR